MIILQVIPTLGSGGAEHFVLELSNELIRQGHQVEILSLYDVPESNSLRQSLNTRIKVSSMHKNKGLDPRLFISVYKYIRSRGYDAVHCHVGAIKYVTLAAFLCQNIKFVATIHSEASREAGKYIDKWSRKLMFRKNICQPVTISDESERSFEAFYGKSAVIIANGVSNYYKIKEVNLRDNDSQIVFLHAASCQSVKNQRLLFTAFNKLLEQGYDAKVVWVGNNKTFYSLYESLLPLMQREVTFLGEVENVRDYMVAADAICLSSKMEGMPMTIIEAFSVGRPVLCTPVGGCVDMIRPGENGMMSEDLEVESYYKMLRSFMNLSKAERQLMSANAYASFVEYTIGSCANKYLEVYRMDKQ
jgi:glycosyltransferase involved in cell wall biosynthesis